MSRRIILALSCGALALAGCGGGKKDSGAATTPVTPTAAATPSTGTVLVLMQANKFAPDKITVHVGQKIHWQNNDSYPHTVTADDNKLFASDPIKGGGTFDYTAKKIGKIPYICTIHSGQTGTITVVR
jgi:plastocyanin